MGASPWQTRIGYIFHNTLAEDIYISFLVLSVYTFFGTNGSENGFKNHNQTLGSSTEKPISGMFCGRTLMAYRRAFGKCPCSNPGTRKANRKIRINETGKSG
jgi:hypothetical protein